MVAAAVVVVVAIITKKGSLRQSQKPNIKLFTSKIYIEIY